MKDTFHCHHVVDASEISNYLLFIFASCSRQCRAQRGDGKEDLADAVALDQKHPAVFDTQPIDGDILFLESEGLEHDNGGASDDTVIIKNR